MLDEGEDVGQDLAGVELVGQAVDHWHQRFFGKALDIRMDARPRTVGTFASQIRHFESVRSFLTSSTLFILADAPFALLFVIVIAMISAFATIMITKLTITIWAVIAETAIVIAISTFRTWWSCDCWR